MVNSAIQSDPHFEIRPTPPSGGGPTSTPPPGGGATPTPPPGGGATPTPTPAPQTPAPPNLSFSPSGVPPWNLSEWLVSGAQATTVATVHAYQRWDVSQDSGGWLAVSGSGDPASPLTISVVQPNDTGIRRTATVIVRAGSQTRSLTITQLPAPVTIRETNVIDSFRGGYLDVGSMTTSTIRWNVSGARVEMPIWSFVHVVENVFAIRNYTTGRYFTVTNQNIRHEVRISGSGTTYDDRQLWRLIPSADGTYRIRSVLNDLYVTEGFADIMLSIRNTSNNSQLWRIGYIWHVAARYANDPAIANWVGFWGPGAINIWVEPVGIEPDGFNFVDRMDIARNAWVNALGITFRDATEETANIRAYGGHRGEIQRHLDRDTPFNPNTQRFGVAFEDGVVDPINGRVGTIQAGGVTRNVFRFSGTGSRAMIMAVFTDNGVPGTYDQRNIDFATMTAMHELGHALGYIGHSPNSSDVMLGVIPRTMRNPNERLNPAEVEHLRQIYRNFR